MFQETFLQLYVSRGSFDQSKPLRPWLFTIAANKAKDALRRRQRIDSTNLGSMFDGEEYSIDDVLNTLDHDDHLPYDDLIRDETAAAVKRVIARMPVRLREILILAYFHKFSYAEIGGILGNSRGHGQEPAAHGGRPVCGRLECGPGIRDRQLTTGALGAARARPDLLDLTRRPRAAPKREA